MISTLKAIKCPNQKLTRLEIIDENEVELGSDEEDLDDPGPTVNCSSQKFCFLPLITLIIMKEK